MTLQDEQRTDLGPEVQLPWEIAIQRGHDLGRDAEIERQVAGKPCPPRTASAEAMRLWIRAKANQVQKELDQDSDPVALARLTAELTVLMAWWHTRP